jgi:hypothetical protein
MQNSTDDEAGNNQSTKRIVPRYHFDYPVLSADDILVFSTKAFWDGFYSSEACAFAKLICRIRHPRYKPGSAQEQQALLEQALPEFVSGTASLAPYYRRLPRFTAPGVVSCRHHPGIAQGHHTCSRRTRPCSSQSRPGPRRVFLSPLPRPGRGEYPFSFFSHLY